MVSSTLGSPTKTCWKRRSSAGSFSIRSRYSSSVVAPIIRSSPRASIGLSMLPASIARVAAGARADDGVQLVDEGDDLAVGVLDLLEHGLEPLLELAAVLRAGHHRGRGRARPGACPASESGTSPATIRWARPSTTAVLPTPGSPISTGLFLVRRDSTCTTRRISASRPITGSSLPSRRRRGQVDAVLLQRLVVWLRGRRCVTRLRSAPSRSRRRARPAVAPCRGSSSATAGPTVLREPDEQVLGGHELVAALSGEVLGGPQHPVRRGCERRALRRSRPSRWCGGQPGLDLAGERAALDAAASSTAAAMPSACASRVESRCRGSTWLWPSAAARRTAPAIAS